MTLLPILGAQLDNLSNRVRILYSSSFFVLIIDENPLELAGLIALLVFIREIYWNYRYNIPILL